MDMSFEKNSHQYFIWIISMVCVCVVDEKKFITNTFNRSLIHIMQAMCLSHYFLSGLSKIKIIVKKGLPEPLYELALAPIAHSLERQVGPSSFFINIFTDFPWFIFIGWVLIFLFQLFCIVPILNRKILCIMGFVRFSLSFNNRSGHGDIF